MGLLAKIAPLDVVNVSTLSTIRHGIATFASVMIYTIKASGLVATFTCKNLPAIRAVSVPTTIAFDEIITFTTKCHATIVAALCKAATPAKHLVA